MGTGRANQPITLALAVAVAAATAPACRFSGPGLGADAAGPPDAPPDAAIDASPDGPRTDWWNTAWTRRRPITIDTSKLTAGPVADFPLLVRLTQQLVDLTGSRSNALRFVTTDNTTVLPYELDTLDTAATSFVWVRMPGLTNAAAQATLWLYYSNNAAPPVTAGAGVFADLYVSVHHMGAGGGPNLPDSTGKNHTATAPGGGQTPQSVPIGHIGGARDFDGNDDYYQLAGEPDYDFTTTLTVSAWIQRQQLDDVYQAIVCKGDDTWRMHRENTTPFAGFGTTSGGSGNNDNLQGTTNIDNANWNHIAIVVGGGVKRLYVNGQQDVMANEGPIDTDNTAVQIGHNSNAVTSPDRFWNGNIDEVRISAATRDAAWIFAEHLTVNDPTFVSIGPEEPYAP